MELQVLRRDFSLISAWQIRCLLLFATPVEADFTDWPSGKRLYHRLVRPSYG